MAVAIFALLIAAQGTAIAGLADAGDGVPVETAILVDCPPARAYEGEEPFAWYDEPNGCTAFCEGHIYDAGMWYGSCWYYPTPAARAGMERLAAWQDAH